MASSSAPLEDPVLGDRHEVTQQWTGAFTIVFSEALGAEAVGVAPVVANL